MLSPNQRAYKQDMLNDIRDLSRVPKHLYKKWWREDYLLFDYNGDPVWPAGLPDSLSFKVICQLHREYVLWTTEPIGLYKPENLGKIDSDSAEYDS